MREVAGRAAFPGSATLQEHLNHRPNGSTVTDLPVRVVDGGNLVQRRKEMFDGPSASDADGS